MLTKLSRVIFFTGIIFIGLIHLTGTVNGYEGPKVFFFQRWVELLLLVTLVRMIFPQEKQDLPFWPVLLLVSYFLWNVLASFYGVDFTTSFYGLFWRGQGLLMLAHYLTLAIIIPVIFEKKDLPFLGKTVGFLGVVAGVWLFIGILGKEFFDFPLYLYLERPVGSFGNPNFLAGFVATTLPFAWYFRSLWKRLVILALGSLTLLLTSSRGAVMAVIMGAALFKGGWKLAILLLSMGVFFLWYSESWRVSRFDPLAAQSRQRIYTRGVMAVLKSPTMGYGLENYELAVKNIVYPMPLTKTGEVLVDKAHNEILEVALGGGLVGLVIWGAIVTRTLFALKSHPVFLLAFLVLVLRMQINVTSTAEYALFWLLIGVGIIGHNQHKSLSAVGRK